MSIAPHINGNRVVITGLGIVSAAGAGADVFWDAVTKGTSCVTPIAGAEPASGWRPWIGAQVPDIGAEDVAGGKLKKFMDRGGAFALAAGRAALADAGLADDHEARQRIEVCVGTCAGAIEWCEHQFRRVADTSIRLLHPYTSIVGYPGNLVGLLTIGLGLRCRGIVLSTLDAAGIDALTYAHSRIGAGAAPLLLVGAADAPLTTFLYALFDRAGLLSHADRPAETACRPFDIERDGIVLGEGAVMLVLEEYEHARARGARIYSELASCVVTKTARANGNGHPVDRNGFDAPIARALALAGVGPRDLDYVNAGGCGLPVQDRHEATAIARVLGADADRVPASSITPVVGHALSVSGLLQTALCALTFAHGALPPTVNCDAPDPACRLNHIRGTAVSAAPGVVLQSTGSLLQRHRAAIVHTRVEPE